VAATSSAKDCKFERVFYKAGLELKGEDKYSAFVKHIGNQLESIQLVYPLAIMHTVDESGGTKPLGSKSEMSINMTVFLAYAPVRRNAKAFQPKKNNNRRKGRKGKLVFSSDVEPEIIISRMAHKIGRAGFFLFSEEATLVRRNNDPIHYLFSLHIQ